MSFQILFSYKSRTTEQKTRNSGLVQGLWFLQQQNQNLPGVIPCRSSFFLPFIFLAWASVCLSLYTCTRASHVSNPPPTQRQTIPFDWSCEENSKKKKKKKIIDHALVTQHLPTQLQQPPGVFSLVPTAPTLTDILAFSPLVPFLTPLMFP